MLLSLYYDFFAVVLSSTQRNRVIIENTGVSTMDCLRHAVHTDPNSLCFIFHR